MKSTMTQSRSARDRMIYTDRPDWRWHVADQQLDGTCRYEVDDKWVAEIVDYRRALSEAVSDDDRRAVESCHPDLHQAVQLREEDGPPAWEMEARAIAGEPDERIAEVTGIDLKVVEMYLAAFVDVRGHLKQELWLHRHCILERCGREGVRNDGDEWRVIALMAGSAAINIVTAEYHCREEPVMDKRADFAASFRDFASIQHGDPTSNRYIDTLRRIHDRHTDGSKQYRAAEMCLDTVDVVQGRKRVDQLPGWKLNGGLPE